MVNWGLKGISGKHVIMNRHLQEDINNLA